MNRLTLIALGSNLGDRQANLLQACRAIAARLRSDTFQLSSLYQTPPWGNTDQPEFLNAVCSGRSDSEPEELLTFLLDLENKMGRPTRHPKWGPRLIDLDLIWMEGVQQRSEKLTLPHPEAARRAFVMEPLRELQPEIATELVGDSDWPADPAKKVVSRDQLLADLAGKQST
jgi:2-amino-4-hydroxy-6-hydroxymethyldihydropteridine diphosphokinase